MTSTRSATAVATALKASRHAIALTGAGVSTPSGIPDFRSPHGLWARYDFQEYGTIQAFHQNPYKVWKLFLELQDTVENASPNAAHEALAEMERRGLLRAIVTQNIDLLHQRAGSKTVVEFHGSYGHFTCLQCRKRFDREQAQDQLDDEGIPHCTCGYPLKPDIVLFGETIPADPLHRSFQLAEKSDLILVVGTSATVAPASSLPAVVLNNQGTVVEANLARTDLSRIATLRLPGDAAVTLPEVVEALDRLA